MELESTPPPTYTLMLRENDVMHLNFDGPEYVTLVLGRENVHVTNRVLGFLSGKEEMVVKNAPLAAWRDRVRGKARAVHLKLMSPHSDARTIIIQADWWGAVLRAPCRSLYFDATHPTYIHDILALVPKHHAIGRVTMERVPVDKCLSFARSLRAMNVAHLAFVRCGIIAMTATLSALLSEEYPAVRNLTIQEDDSVKVDLQAVLGQIIAYFAEYFCSATDKNVDLVFNDDAALYVDIVCFTPEAAQFLLPRNLHVRINGVEQEMVDTDAPSTHPVAMRRSRQHYESSDEGEGSADEEAEAAATTAKSAKSSAATKRPRKAARLALGRSESASEDDDDATLIETPVALCRNDEMGEEDASEVDNEEEEDNEEEDAQSDGGKEDEGLKEEEDDHGEEEEEDMPASRPSHVSRAKKGPSPTADALVNMFGHAAAARMRRADPALARVMRRAAEASRKSVEAATPVTCPKCQRALFQSDMRDHRRYCRGAAGY